MSICVNSGWRSFFVAEAADDLEIALEARHHQELLEELGRLRQRVEAARLEPARHQEVPRAFGSRARQEGRLHLEEAVLVEVVAHGAAEQIADLEALEDGRAAHVEVPVLQAECLVHLGVSRTFDLEG